MDTIYIILTIIAIVQWIAMILIMTDEFYDEDFS